MTCFPIEVEGNPSQAISHEARVRFLAGEKPIKSSSRYLELVKRVMSRIFSCAAWPNDEVVMLEQCQSLISRSFVGG